MSYNPPTPNQTPPFQEVWAERDCACEWTKVHYYQHHPTIRYTGIGSTYAKENDISRRNRGCKRWYLQKLLIFHHDGGISFRDQAGIYFFAGDRNMEIAMKQALSDYQSKRRISNHSNLLITTPYPIHTLRDWGYNCGRRIFAWLVIEMIDGFLRFLGLRPVMS